MSLLRILKNKIVYLKKIIKRASKKAINKYKSEGKCVLGIDIEFKKIIDKRGKKVWVKEILNQS